MMLNDNGREYDTGRIPSYSAYTQRIILRLIYTRYDGIRTLLSDCCCRKVKLVEIREAIKDEKNINRIKETFGYTDEEILFYVDYTDQHIPMAR